MATRIDQLLVARGLAPSRSAAARLIGQGAVQWRLGPADWHTCHKAGEALPEHGELRLTDTRELRWVSRAGLKLDGALDRLGLTVSGEALDVGQSTGGFTEVLLARGARRVVGIEVGQGQLAAPLRQHPQVLTLEGVNARHLGPEHLDGVAPAPGFDWLVADLSFISQTLVWPALLPWAAPHAQWLMLVKPQFELQPQHIGKGGLVKHEHLYAEVEHRLRHAAQALGLRTLAWIDSPITGGDGNREFFIHLAR